VICLKAVLPLLRALSKKVLLKRTMAGRRILSTIYLTLFEVLLSMIVLPAAQVLLQSQEEGISELQERRLRRATLFASESCLVVRVLLLCS